MDILGVYGSWPDGCVNLGILQIPSGKLTQLLKMAIEIVDLPIKDGDFPQLCQFTRGYIDFFWEKEKMFFKHVQLLFGSKMN